MNLHEHAESVKTKDDLVPFIRALRSDLSENRDAWENPTLESFLEAMEAWIGDMNGYYLNQGQQPPERPDWRTFALILAASRIYE
jgi:hypothetical protein